MPPSLQPVGEKSVVLWSRQQDGYADCFGDNDVQMSSRLYQILCEGSKRSLYVIALQLLLSRVARDDDEEEDDGGDAAKSIAAT